ncbi:TIGR03086 family metal-binding protein [soil metagenome]
MSLIETVALTRADAEVARRLTLVDEDRWERPSACAGWTVGDLVDHLIGGNAYSMALLDGASADEAMERAHAVAGGEAPRRVAYTPTAKGIRKGLDQPGAVERTYPHVVGEVTGHVMAGLRATDLALHAWDLARSIGADEDLDDELVAFVAATADEMGLWEDASAGEAGSPQRRLLLRSGRDPDGATAD